MIPWPGTRRAEALHRRCPAIAWEGEDPVRVRVVVLSTTSASSPDSMEIVVEVGGGKDAMGQPRWRAIPLQPGEALTDIHAGIPKAERFDRFLRRLPQNLRFIKDIVEAERKRREKS